MRHKFSREETLKGVRNAVSARKAELKLKKKELKDRSKEWFMEQLEKFSEPDRLAYMAAFAYGAIAAYESHKDVYNDKGMLVRKGLKTEDLASEAFRQGLEAILALKLCTTQSPGLSASTTQSFGVLMLTGIGLQIPLSAIEVALAGSKDPTKTFGITNPDFITAFNKWFAAMFPGLT